MKTYDHSPTAGFSSPARRAILNALAEGMMAKTMIEYLRARSSIRAFKPDPVPRDKLERIIAAGFEGPSWSNTQPYLVGIAEGALRDAIAADLCARFDRGMELMAMPKWRRILSALLQGGRPKRDYPVPDAYPADLQPRRAACGYGLYGALGIERRDMAARNAQMRRNFHFFDAPVELFIWTHAGLNAYAPADAGAFIQSVMLAALDEGLGTCAQAAVSSWPEAVTPRFEVPPHYKLLCGIAVGYPADDKVNRFRPARLGLDALLVKAKA